MDNEDRYGKRSVRDEDFVRRDERPKKQRCSGAGGPSEEPRKDFSRQALMYLKHLSAQENLSWQEAVGAGLRILSDMEIFLHNTTQEHYNKWSLELHSLASNLNGEGKEYLQPYMQPRNDQITKANQRNIEVQALQAMREQSKAAPNIKPSSVPPGRSVPPGPVINETKAPSYKEHVDVNEELEPKSVSGTKAPSYKEHVDVNEELEPKSVGETKAPPYKEHVDVNEELEPKSVQVKAEGMHCSTGKVKVPCEPSSCNPQAGHKVFTGLQIGESNIEAKSSGESLIPAVKSEDGIQLAGLPVEATLAGGENVPTRKMPPGDAISAEEVEVKAEEADPLEFIPLR